MLSIENVFKNDVLPLRPRRFSLLTPSRTVSFLHRNSKFAVLRCFSSILLSFATTVWWNDALKGIETGGGLEEEENENELSEEFKASIPVRAFLFSTRASRLMIKLGIDSDSTLSINEATLTASLQTGTSMVKEPSPENPAGSISPLVKNYQTDGALQLENNVLQMVLIHLAARAVLDIN
ncbi:hypothetical protein PHJA_001350200 [Phtheirospermum japonicum]|uniref:Uncharacterized protein n=1 Tax=Phtheirospermum japonicum TaxID=374723 RepID=A0A830CCW1_9LAMI|nr:hypothetical protein PHJA_001350200 [Phtheirospermum japonicum]